MSEACLRDYCRNTWDSDFRTKQTNWRMFGFCVASLRLPLEECFKFWLMTVQALAEKESDGMAKMIYRKDTGEILGVHIFGLHAADLIHEASNAIATKQTVQVGPTYLSTDPVSLTHNHTILSQRIFELHACHSPEWLPASLLYWLARNIYQKCTKLCIPKLIDPQVNFKPNEINSDLVLGVLKVLKQLS